MCDGRYDRIMKRLDLIVVGAGPIGLSMALSLEAAGHEVAIVAPEPRFDAGRTAAVMAPSLDFLAPLLPPDALARIGWPLAGIRIIDATGALFRAPTITFRAAEMGLEHFGLNLPNDAMVHALEAAAAARGIQRFNAACVSLHETATGIEINLADGTALAANGIVGADGRNSVVREAAGISMRSWTYDQSALTFHIQHSVDHLDISTELHTREGPLTFVPLAQGQSSVVWMAKAATAQGLAELGEAAFLARLREASHALMGKVQLAGTQSLIPMSGLTARSFAKGRVALIGEAAHAFPPIGAQGLNLGLRDVRDLGESLRATDDIVKAFDSYARMRLGDVGLRTMAVDALNRSLLLGFLPVDALRSAGFAALSSIPMLKQTVMRLGIGQSRPFELPSLPGFAR
jgi:2-octaprenyl-6-methoxyphenol hydroxylase